MLPINDVVQHHNKLTFTKEPINHRASLTILGRSLEEFVSSSLVPSHAHCNGRHSGVDCEVALPIRDARTAGSGRELHSEGNDFA